jgi:hypothetical protein
VYLIFVWTLPNTYEMFQRYSPVLSKVQLAKPAFLHVTPTWIWGGIFGLLGATALFAMTSSSEFLYFQF